MSTRRFQALFFAILALLSLPSTSHAIDPFYERLLEEGIFAYDNGEHALAAKGLRLACFGLLDDPASLVRGLAYLALAQAELGDEDEFSKTFGRILEVEQRFQAFSELEIEAGLRQVLDGHLQAWISTDRLDRAPIFRQIARRKREAIIRGMDSAERRPELERLVNLEPENPTWALLLAELQLEGGENQAVLTMTGDLLARNPGLESAKCLRGQARIATGVCQQGLEDIESCQSLGDPLGIAAGKVRCFILLRDWQSASTELSNLPQDQKRKTPFRQLAREVKRGAKAAPVPEPEVSSPSTEPGEIVSTEPVGSDVTSPGDSSENLLDSADLEASSTAKAPGDAMAMEDSALEPAPVVEEASPAAGEKSDGEELETVAAEASSALPLELQAELDRIRQRVPSGSRDQLEEALSLATQVADRYQQYSEPQHLAAEIAYRLSRWQDAVSFFERGGEPDLGSPDRLFYFAVALHETGNLSAAQRIIQRCLPSLEMTGFVRSYVEAILGPGEWNASEADS